MPLDFSNAKILTYTQRNDMWGEAFRYASKKELSIQGSMYALNNLSGVNPIWTGVIGWVENANDYDSIILNGVNFGPGRLNSISFKEGNDVRIKDYDANLTIYESGNFYNISGPYYDNLNLNNLSNPIWLTDTFSENFEYAIKDDGSYSSKQNITVKFISGESINNRGTIDMAKGLSSGLFLHPFFNLSGRKIYTENYNLITNECSFSETIESFPPGAFGSNYSIEYSHECNTDQNGITNVTENGKIKGLSPTPSYIANAEAGYDVEVGGLHARNRCNEVMDYYVPSGNPLSNAHIASRKSINIMVGEIDYSISFTNDFRFNVNYIWDYTEQLEREPNSCFYKIVENGHIQGRDNNCTYTQKNTNAINAYNTISSGILGRVTDYYTSGTTGLHNPLKFVASNKKHNPFQGTIDYSATYVDNLYYGISPGIKKIDYDIEDNQPVTKYNKFGILNVKELVQSALIYTPGTQNCSVKVQGERGATFATCALAANTIIVANKPSGSLYFIDKAVFNFNPNQSTLDANVSWQYFIRN